MKLVSQMGGYEKKPHGGSVVLKRLRKAGRRVPWGTVAWCVFAITTALIAVKAVSMLTSTLRTVGGAG